MVKKFIRRAALDTGYLFIVLTYGAHHGGTAEIADLFLKSAGKKADYITSIEMVDNYLPAFDMNKQMAMDKQVEKHLDRIRADVRAKRRGIQKAGLAEKTAHKMYRKMPCLLRMCPCLSPDGGTVYPSQAGKESCCQIPQ